jgi:class 3 adenylate cyclase
MVAMSFRIKLLLAMMLLIAGVTAATLYATQKIVQVAYLKLFQDQFTTELNYFSEQQSARLALLKGPCQSLAGSAPLRDALRKGDAAKVYQIATGDLTEVSILRGGRNVAAKAGTLEEAGLRAGTFVRVLDARGEILRAPNARINRNQQATRKKLEEQLAQVQKSLDSLDSQQIGFLSREAQNGRVNLWEMMVTKIADPTNNRTMGALVVGMLFIDAAESAMNQMSQKTIQSGILLEDKIHSKTIPDAVQAELLKDVQAEIKRHEKPRETFQITLGGTPQRVFLQLLNPDSPFPPAYQVSVYSLAGAMRTQEQLRWQIMGFSLLALLGALVVSLLIAHGLSVPLRELAAATGAVRSGDLDVRVPVRSRDDMGQLAESFNEMAEGLAQKERYRTLLNMVADEKVAKALLDGQLALGGELRDISVLFCDIRGFTAYTQNMPPEEVIEMLNEHMTALTRVVKEHNGVLDKFVGDLLMAIFGAPVSHESDTLNTALCAMALMREREGLNATSRHRLKMGIGIATGRVVAGCMGSFDRLNYTVLGERVNLASRLCSRAAAGQIVIDQTTRDRLGDTITAEPLPALNLKGFSENVVAYELKGVRVPDNVEQPG